MHDNGFADVGEHELKLAIHNDIERYEEEKFDAALNDYKHPMSIVLSCSAEQIEDIHSTKDVKEKRNKALDILYESHPDIYNTIVDYTCKQVTRPHVEAANYKKMVLDVVDRTTNGLKWALRFTALEKKKNIWEAVLDDQGHRIIFNYYHGAAIEVPE